MTPGQNVLDGLKVIDLTRVLSGPWCTQQLGDLGADVVKVERPPDGDDARQYGKRIDGWAEGGLDESTFFASCNRNKRSIVLDFTQPADKLLLRRLVAKADVFVENFKTGTLRKFGLDYESLKQDNPRLIYCSITGFGQDGPYAARPAYDFIMQGAAGLMSSCGEVDMPMRTAVPTTDLIAGSNAAMAILGAVIHRMKSGRGQFIDSAMLDVSVAFNSHLAHTYLATRQDPTRIGNANPVSSPSGLFKTCDGMIIISASNDSQFRILRTALGLGEVCDDPMFSTNQARIANRAALHQIVERVTLTQTTAHWTALFARVSLPAGPVNTLSDVFADPQVQHRRLVVQMTYPDGRQTPTLRSPLNLSDVEISYRPPPALGQHTGEVLAEWLEAGTGTTRGAAT